MKNKCKECDGKDILGNMINEIDANLLEYPLDGFIHACNCMQIMGGGLALQVKNKYPELYQADIKYGRKGDISKLGKFSTIQCHDDKQGYNLYSQFNLGTWARQTNYEAVYTGLLSIKNHAEENNIIKLGLPNGMCCVLGGASWRIVRVIIDDIFGNWNNDLYICNYAG